MSVSRRTFCILTLAAGAGLASAPSWAGVAREIVDAAGRKTSVPAAPKRIVLLEARDLLTMSLLRPDAASLVVGWSAVDRIDSPHLQERLQNSREIAIVGKQSPDTVSIEGILSLTPDLVVTTAFMTPGGDTNPLVQNLTHAGVAVVYSDASSNEADGPSLPDPATQLHRSMRLWGAMLGAEARAEAYIAFNDKTLAEISARLQGAAPVTTYLEVQSTLDDCCWAAGAKVWGELLRLAGGQALPEVNAPWFQKLSLEYVLKTPHEVYIASGGGWSAGGRPAIAPGLDPQAGRDGLRKLVEARTGFSDLASARNGRVYGIWTGLITNLPLNIVFVALVARWLHPERFSDLDPAAILATINCDFTSFPIEGPLWAAI